MKSMFTNPWIAAFYWVFNVCAVIVGLPLVLIGAAFPRNDDE